MRLNISGHHVEITQSLRDYSEDKFNKIKSNFDNIINIDLVLAVEKNIQKAEAVLHMRGTNMFAKVQSDDMYHSILELVKKLESQIIKYKEKVNKYR